MPTAIPPSGMTGPKSHLPAVDLGFPSPGTLPATSRQEKPHPQLANEMRRQIETHALAHSYVKDIMAHCRGNCRANLALFHVLDRCPKAENKDIAHLALVAALAIGEKALEFKRQIGA